MKSTLMIKDLAFDKQLDCKAMSAVRGGQSNQTYQENHVAVDASVNVGNGSAFMGEGSTHFDIVSKPKVIVYNDSTSSNSKGWGGFGYFPL